MLGLALTAGWIGCSSSDASSAAPIASQGCTHNSDCSANLVCLAGRCATACVTDKDCAAGETCVVAPEGNACQADPDGGAAGAGAGCPASQETNLCYQCTDEQCCGEYADCQANANCVSYYKQCLPDCKANGDTFDHCTIQCASVDEAAFALFAKYFACEERHCLGPCGSGNVDPCTACVVAACADIAYACNADAECILIRSCATDCAPGDDVCIAKCKNGHSTDALSHFDQWTTCALSYCNGSC